MLLATGAREGPAGGRMGIAINRITVHVDTDQRCAAQQNIRIL